MKNELRKAKKPFELPHGYIILLCVMLLVAALTWIIPAGEYDIVQNPESGIEEIDPSSFHFVERDDPVTFFGFFTAIADCGLRPQSPPTSPVQWFPPDLPACSDMPH